MSAVPAALAAALLAGLPGCADKAPDSAPALCERGLPEHAPPDVVVIVVDTLRADHLPGWGYAVDTAPNFTAWAEQAALFESAISQGGWTVPAVSALLTGAYPSSTGSLRGTVLESFDLMPERFQSAGYATTALIKSTVYSEAAGYAQGFDRFDFIDGDHRSGRSGEELTDEALDWLDDAACEDTPFFLFLHYLDPHAEYRAPEPWLEAFDAGESTVSGDDDTLWRYKTGEETPSEADLARLKALYDGEIAYWDDQLARVLTAIPEEAAVIVVGDHGEQFLEHGGWVHDDLWQENLHVPFVIRWPGAGPQRVAQRVQTADLLPTLAGLQGWEADPRWQGRDLSAVVMGTGAPPEQFIFTQYNERSALIDADGLKFIRDRSEDRLFDLTADPGETVDLGSARPEDLARLQAQVEALLEENAAILEAASE